MKIFRVGDKIRIRVDNFPEIGIIVRAEKYDKYDDGWEEVIGIEAEYLIKLDSGKHIYVTDSERIDLIEESELGKIKEKIIEEIKKYNKLSDDINFESRICLINGDKSLDEFMIDGEVQQNANGWFPSSICN